MRSIRAVRRFVTEAEDQALQILESHRTEVERLVTELETNETLDRQQIEACLGAPQGQSIAPDVQSMSA